MSNIPKNINNVIAVNITTGSLLSSNSTITNLTTGNISVSGILNTSTVNINTTTVNSSSIGTLYASARMNSVGNMLNSGTAGTLSTIIDLKVMNKRLKCSRQAVENSLSTMNRRTLATSSLWGDICWSSDLGLFVAMSSNGVINTSPDGINWTARTSGISAASAIIWVTELRLFVIVTNTNVANIVTSPDGITWTVQTTPTITGNFYGLCWSPELNLLIATTISSTVLTSSNGINWSASTISGSHRIINVTWSPELLLFVGTEYQQGSFGFAYSTDGINWTGVAQHVNNQWWGITWSPELFMFVATLQDNNAAPIATSPDGKNWTRQTCTAQFTTKIVWNAELSMFMTTGQSGNIFTSNDAITWVNRYSAGTNTYGCWSPELSIFAIVQYNSNICITSLPAIPSSKSAVLASPSQLNVNHSTGNVGINTTAPGFTLDVNGTINSDNIILTSGSIGNLSTSDISVSGNLTAVNVINTTISVGTLIASTGITSGALLISGLASVANLSATTATISNLMTTNISTSTINSVQYLGNVSDTITTPSFSWTTDTNTGIYHPATDNIGFVTDGVERLRIGTSGNIGLNNPNPSQNISICAENSSIGSSFGIFGGNEERTSTLYLCNPFLGGTAGNALKVALIASPTGNGWGRSNLHFALDNSADNSLNASLTNGVRMSILASGNVGINTTAPGFTLDVNGTINSANIICTNITSTNIVVSGSFVANFNSNRLGNLYTTGGNISINTSTPNINSILTLHNGNLITNTGGTQIAFNLGTSAGGYTHYINTRHQSLVGDNRNAIDFLINNSTSAAGSIGLAGGSGNVNSMSVTATGVGIFNNLPGFTLDVNGSINASTFLTSGNVYSTNITSSNIVGTNISSSTLNIKSTQSNPLNLTTSFSGDFTNLALLFAPNQTNGNNNCSTRIFHGQGVGANFNSGQIGFNFISSNNNSNFASFGVYGTSPILNVNGQGNVGIGTTSPSATLDVNGLIRNSGSFINKSTFTTTTSGNIRFAVCESGHFDAKFRITQSVAGNHVNLIVEVNGVYNQNGGLQQPTIVIKRGEFGGGTLIPSLIVSVDSIPNYLSYLYLKCVSGITLNITLMEGSNVTLNTPVIEALAFGNNTTYSLLSTGLVLGSFGKYLNVNSNGIGINTSSGSYPLDVNGTLARSGVRLPRFDNGTFTGASTAVIPILFGDSTYNYVEIKVRYIVSNTCNITLSGSISSNGSSPFAANEKAETTVKYNAQSTPTYTNLGYISQNNDAYSVDNMVTIKITRSSSTGTRNHYQFDTVYLWGGNGTARVYGMGHLDTASNLSTQLLSIIMTCSTGTISGTYSTQHSY